MTKVLVTGASGFIGRALAPALVTAGYEVIAPTRAETGEIGPETDWERWLDGVEGVVHLAGLAHARHDEDAFLRVNAHGTRRLAAQAADTGVNRFVLMSSVKAASDRSGERGLTEADAPSPGTLYGRSKLAAEQAVVAISSLQAVALRPPLVHAADARANFATLLLLAASPLPLPFAGAQNRRSLIARASLIEAVLAVLAKPDAPGGVFYVADQPALSIAEMITALRQGLARRPNLFAGEAFVRRGPGILSENLEIDDSKFRAAFAFEGRDSRAALADTAAAWKTRSR